MVEARTDTLTGLANRRAADRELQRRYAEWERRGTPVSVMMVDLDRFKLFNDDYGHQAGDAVLQGVAGVLAGAARDMDLVARYGGEEFLVILPVTSLQDAALAAERLRGKVAATKFHFEGKDLSATVSVGLAEVRTGDTLPSLLGNADAALYAAKNSGRNCGFFHNGRTCEPIAAMPPRDRQPAVVWIQRIAPRLRNVIPPASALFEVECENVSGAGMSFFVPEPPDYQHLVVELKIGKEQFYVAAVIKSFREVSVGETRRYRVGCQFLRRIEPVAPVGEDPLAVPSVATPLGA
jgi:diguanylate cyclase (GGDEF)-like protein